MNKVYLVMDYSYMECNQLCICATRELAVRELEKEVARHNDDIEDMLKESDEEDDDGIRLFVKISEDRYEDGMHGHMGIITEDVIDK